MQRMDTSGRMVLGSGGGQEQAKQMFGKVRERERGESERSRVQGLLCAASLREREQAKQMLGNVWGGVGRCSLQSLQGLAHN